MTATQARSAFSYGSVRPVRAHLAVRIAVQGGGVSGYGWEGLGGIESGRRGEVMGGRRNKGAREKKG